MWRICYFIHDLGSSEFFYPSVLNGEYKSSEQAEAVARECAKFAEQFNRTFYFLVFDNSIEGNYAHAVNYMWGKYHQIKEKRL